MAEADSSDTTNTTKRKDVWLPVKYPLASETKISTEDWPSLEETITKVNKLTLEPEVKFASPKPKWVPLELELDLPSLKSRRNGGTGRANHNKWRGNGGKPTPTTPANKTDDPIGATTPPEETHSRKNSLKLNNNKKRGNKKPKPFALPPDSPPSFVAAGGMEYEYGMLASPPPLPLAPTDFFMPYILSPVYMPDYYHQQQFPVVQQPTPILMDEIVLSGLLRTQIEYYFSEENLSRDFYLRRKMDSEGYLPIHLIASFQRVQSLTQDFNKVLAAAESSSKLEVKDGCVRTVFDPLSWPIVDSVPVSPVALMPPHMNFAVPATTMYYANHYQCTLSN